VTHVKQEEGVSTCDTWHATYVTCQAWRQFLNH